MSAAKEDAYRLYQGGLMVAAAYGPESAREIVHYANVYLSEGPVDIVRRKPNGRWPKPPRPKEGSMTEEGKLCDEWIGWERELMEAANSAIFYDRPDLQFKFDASAPPLLSSPHSIGEEE